MEKELFITTLKGKAGVDNVSERSYEEVAGLILPQFAEDDKITDESWNIPVQMIKTMSGQLRHDLSTGINDYKTKAEADAKTAQEAAIAKAIADAKAEWEKAHNDNGGSPDNGGNGGQQNQNQDVDKKIADALAKAISGLTGEEGALGKLSKQFSDFMTQVAAEKKAQTVASIKDQIKEHLIGRGVEEDDYALEIAMEKLEIGDNPDVAALKTKAEKDYEAIYKRMHKNDGAQPFNGGGGNHNDSNKEFQDFINARKAQAEQEAKEAEELKKLMM